MSLSAKTSIAISGTEDVFRNLISCPLIKLAEKYGDNMEIFLDK